MQERREIEAALFTGKLWGVAATNALELGVDVGSLDATLHLGFPGALTPRDQPRTLSFVCKYKAMSEWCLCSRISVI